MFGSVSTKQIAEALKAQHDIKIDKRKMDLPNGIHSLGYTNVPVKLDEELKVQLAYTQLNNKVGLK